MDLKHERGKVLVKGASLGNGVARAFAEECANLQLTARSTEKLDELKARIQEKHSVQVALRPIDLTEPGTCKKLSDAVGDVDILVNNDGAICSGYLRDIDETNWRSGSEPKVLGNTNLSKLFDTKMKAACGGISSRRSII